MEVSYCEPEHGPLLGEDDEMKIEDDFLNTLISSELPEEDLVDTTNEESDVLKSNYFCAIAHNEEHLDDVFMQVDKEMKHRMNTL